MNSNYKTIVLGTLAIEALEIMEQHKITSLVVINKAKNMVGIIHMHDVLQAGVA